MYEFPSATKIFLKFEILWVKTFQIAKSKHRHDDVHDSRYTKTKLFAFRATNAVLDSDRAQPSWRPWPQERLLLFKKKLSTVWSPKSNERRPEILGFHSREKAGIKMETF